MHLDMCGMVEHKTQLVVMFCSVTCCVLASDSSGCEKTDKITASSETGDSLSDDNSKLESKINKTLDTLKSLDATLAQNCNDPPLDGGGKMKEMIQEYNQACSDLLSLCKKDKMRVLGAASDMLEPGGPKFLDVGINKDEMKVNFKWDEDNVDEFITLTKKTYTCWKQLWSLYNNFP